MQKKQQQQQTSVSVVMEDEQKEAKSTSPEPTQLERRHSKGRQIMNRIMNPFSSGSSSSAKLSHIQSAAMTDDDKTKSLAIFQLDGLDLATTRTDAFMQDSWAEPKHRMKMINKPAQKPDESPKRKAPPPPRPPLPLHKSFEDSDKHHIQRAPLEQRFSVQPADQLQKPRRPVQRSHSSAGSTNLVKREEPNVIPPAVAPRNHRPTSQLPQGLKKPMIPPPKKPSTKAHNHEGLASSDHGQRKGSPPMPRDPNHRPVSPNTREVTEKGT